MTSTVLRLSRGCLCDIVQDVTFLISFDIKGAFDTASWPPSPKFVKIFFALLGASYNVVQLILHWVTCFGKRLPTIVSDGTFSVEFNYEQSSLKHLQNCADDGPSGNLGNDRADQLAKMSVPLSHWKHLAWERTVSS
ncbi:hypothetical protein TNCV_3481911 [Trichonephila clavipes]|nr:hypothetical protein TNCV_3481911 [Trichonephila clavipes]